MHNRFPIQKPVQRHLYKVTRLCSSPTASLPGYPCPIYLLAALPDCQSIPHLHASLPGYPMSDLSTRCPT